jgi:hypothetical protein
MKRTAESSKYRVYFHNFGHYAETEYDVLGHAIDHGKDCGFEFGVWRNGNLVYSWSPLYGSRRYATVEK